MRRFVLGLLAAGLVGCFDPGVVQGLPCEDDEGCGDGYQCVIGICRDADYDPTSTCGDGTIAVGEACYGERSFEAGGFSFLQRVDANGDDIIDFVTAGDGGLSMYLADGEGDFVEQRFALVLARESIIEGLGVTEDIIAMYPNFFDGLADQDITPQQVAIGNFGGDPLQGDAVVRLPSLDVTIPPAIAMEYGDRFPTAWLWVAYDVHEGTNELQRIAGSRPDSTSTVALGAVDVRPNGMHAGDFDGDGLDEVLVLGPGASADARSWWLPDLESSPPQELLAAGTQQQPTIADLDGDGRDELVGWLDDEGAVVGPGFADPSVGPRTFTIPDDTTDFALADRDGDGRLEMFVARGSTGEFQILTLAEDLAYGDPEIVEADAGDAIGTGDIDADGDLDVILSVGAAVVAYYDDPDAGYFATFGLVDGARENLLLGRFDGDAALDIASATPDGGTLEARVDFADP